MTPVQSHWHVVAGIVLLTSFAFMPCLAQASDNFRQRASVSQYVSELAAADVSAEIEFGREIAAQVLGRYPLYNKHQELNHYINLVGSSIAVQSSRPELDFYFAILDTDEINAYAAPGGYVFITRGALAQMEDESELAGVLAHEIAHISQKHIVTALNIHGTEHSAGSALAHMIGAVNDSTRTAFNQAVDHAVSILFEEGLNKESEYESDQVGTVFLANAGYDPQGLSRYLARIKEAKENNLKVLSTTHPPLASRLTVLGDFTKSEQLSGIESKRFESRFNKNITLE